MNRLSKDKRDKILMIAGATGVVVFLIWKMVIGSQKESIVQYGDQKVDVEGQIFQAERTIKRAKFATDETELLRTKLDAIEQNIPPLQQLKGPLWLLEKVNALVGDKYDLRITQFTDPVVSKIYSPFPAYPDFFPYQTAAYTVEMSGYYHEFGRFLADLERTFPLFRVQDVTMTPLAMKTAAALGDEADGPVTLGGQQEKLSVTFRIVVLARGERSV